MALWSLPNGGRLPAVDLPVFRGERVAQRFVRPLFSIAPRTLCGQLVLSCLDRQPGAGPFPWQRHPIPIPDDFISPFPRCHDYAYSSCHGSGGNFENGQSTEQQELPRPLRRWPRCHHRLRWHRVFRWWRLRRFHRWLQRRWWWRLLLHRRRSQGKDSFPFCFQSLPASTRF